MQEQVLVHGGPFWRNVPRTQEHTKLISQQWLSLRAELYENASNEDEPVTKLDTIPAEFGLTPPVVTLSRTSLSVHRRWLIGLAALAATILVVIYSPIFQKTDGRFFAARDIRESKLVGNDHLRLIATRIQNDWKPELDDKRAFEKQLTELRDSCDVLLAPDGWPAIDFARRLLPIFWDRTAIGSVPAESTAVPSWRETRKPMLSFRLAPDRKGFVRQARSQFLKVIIEVTHILPGIESRAFGSQGFGRRKSQILSIKNSRPKSMDALHG